jgi:hypothetical protein
MTIAVYVGHEEGQREAEDLLKEITELDSKHFSVMNINFINRKNAPFLLVIEKNDSYREDI